MFEAIANSLVRSLYAYAAIGFLFALGFVTIGITRIDHEAEGSSLWFRFIIMPGVVALWPLLAFRWMAGYSGPPVQKDPHR